MGLPINIETTDDLVLKARMNYINHQSDRTIWDRFPNNRLSLNEVTKSDIRKRDQNLNKPKI